MNGDIVLDNGNLGTMLVFLEPMLRNLERVLSALARAIVLTCDVADS